MSSKFTSGQNITPDTLTPEHVRELPLATITQNFGSLGLLLKLRDTYEQTGLDKDPVVTHATNFGLMLHANDKRSNGEYVDHLMRVTFRIADTFKITDPNIIAAAMLHDAVEDHPREITEILSGQKEHYLPTAKEKALDLIGKSINPEVAEIVAAVTNPEVPEGSDPQTVYEQHVSGLVMMKPKARVVKLSDFIDNAVGNHHTADARRPGLDRKYVGQFGVHMSGLFRPDSLIKPEVATKLLSQLLDGHVRALARLANGD